jgi:hypothetical protein
MLTPASKLAGDPEMWDRCARRLFCSFFNCIGGVKRGAVDYAACDAFVERNIQVSSSQSSEEDG